MSNPFSHPRRRVEQARRHIASLRQHCETYEASATVLRIIETDPKTGYHIHKAKLETPLPAELIDDAVSAVESLRAALDLAGYAAAEACGGTALENTAFPFAETEERLIREAAKKSGRSKHLPKPILDLFLGFKPYRDGSYRLWALNELAKGSKHRTLVPTIFGAPDASIQRFQHHGGPQPQFTWPPKWDPNKAEAVFAIAYPTSRFTYAGSFRLRVTLGGHQVFSRFPASDVLEVIAEEVATIVSATEDKVREMGFLKQ